MCLTKNKQAVKRIQFERILRAERPHDPSSSSSDTLTNELLEDNRIYYYNDLPKPVNKSVAVRFRIKML